MTDDTLVLADETRGLVDAVGAIVARIAVVNPELGEALSRWGIRIAYDSREQTVLISVVGPDGVGRALLAVDGHPGAGFGEVGVPVALPLYDRPAGGVTH